MNKLKCRACNSNKIFEAINLGTLPIANELLLNKNTKTNTYPLNLLICENCFLGQVGTALPEERIFRDYRYLSSMSNDFLDHAKVINGASDLIAKIFPENLHSRIAIGCNSLPLNSCVEIESIFEIN